VDTGGAVLTVRGSRYFGGRERKGKRKNWGQVDVGERYLANDNDQGVNFRKKRAGQQLLCQKQQSKKIIDNQKGKGFVVTIEERGLNRRHEERRGCAGRTQGTTLPRSGEKRIKCSMCTFRGKGKNEHLSQLGCV